MITQEMILAAKNAETNVAALIAVYPLILEEVAKFYDECDERIIAQTIRNMKDKTDE